MRARAVALSLLLVGLVVLPPPVAAEDFTDVDKVNELVAFVSTPQLAPGESGKFVFYLNSTYAEPIQDVRLNASIYRYATIEESISVDGAWRYAYPKIAESASPEAREWVWTAPVLPAVASNLLNFTILTAADSHDMPHGSVFSQASYFVRLWLEFDGTVNGNTTRYRMASFGFFGPDLWARATPEEYKTGELPCDPPWCRGNVNLTILGVDGILPDTAFGVKEPIPRWPFYALTILAATFLVLAFLFWVEENPGSYPRIEAWWARTRGRLARTFAPLRPVRRPKG